ncbi:hypothetical protein ASPZODRAFT_222303 [Penicilliopsis zonata CBS 506.65]|uniref:Haloacid dehalogenase, type II n=1 Tax=Penicilliopsis zonata CBS 506.65 TaxID=1073090 RepID=A0A1L9SU82_9EURO|nr:hypothetical protein ASPZODRAFT_222303 [Penicilliopsis zonata CBS 506.65]OJJ50633.1 hypothetical protein ASPZODRAFT_222303 [Penicilliopsis zonata CBS 506.65]
MSPRAIVFDLLTALLDSWTLWNKAAGSEAAGRRWRARYLELTFGCGAYRPYEDLVRESARDAGLDHSVPESLLATWDELQPWPEAPEVLRQLRQAGYLLGVVTNCSMERGRRAAARCEEAAAVSSAPCTGRQDSPLFLFDVVITAEESGFYKPRAEAYAAVLAALGVQPADALFVAGSSGDVLGAAKVGMPVVWHNRIGLKPLPGSAPLIHGQSLREVLFPLLSLPHQDAVPAGVVDIPHHQI